MLLVVRVRWLEKELCGHSRTSARRTRFTPWSPLSVARAGGAAGERRRVEVVFEGGVADMPQGTIKKLVAEKGFGFISGERGDIFFHHSVVADGAFDDLQEGQAVEYSVEADA